MKEWAEFEPEAEGCISYEDFWKFSGKVLKIYIENGLEKEGELGG